MLETWTHLEDESRSLERGARSLQSVRLVLLLLMPYWSELVMCLSSYMSMGKEFYHTGNSLLWWLTFQQFLFSILEN